MENRHNWGWHVGGQINAVFVNREATTGVPKPDTEKRVPRMSRYMERALAIWNELNLRRKFIEAASSIQAVVDV